MFWSSYTVIILLAHCSRSIQSILFCKNSFWRTGKVWTYQVHVWIISGTFERLVFYFSLTELYEIGFCGTSEKIWIHDNDCHDLWHEKDFQNLGNDFEIVSREWVKTNLFLKEKKKRLVEKNWRQTFWTIQGACLAFHLWVSLLPVVVFSPCIFRRRFKHLRNLQQNIHV